MTDEHRKPGWGPPRRRFLQQAGLATAGAALATGWSRHVHGAERAGLEGVGPSGCDCAFEAALGLSAAAYFRGNYLGLAATQSGPGVFVLDIDSSGNVTQGPRVEAGIPKDFVFGSLGVAKGSLMVSGGRRFVWDRYEVDDELSDDVRALLDMDTFPSDVPTSGTRTIEVPGVRPEVLVLDPPSVEALVLPGLPSQAFGVATEVAETEGGFAVLVEHCGGENESFYAAAVDVLEERDGRWTMAAAGRSLGESGPNHMAAQGDDLVVALSTADGVRLVSGRSSRPLAAPPGAGRIFAMVSGDGGLTVLGAGRDGVARSWSQVPGSAWSRSRAIRSGDDDVVYAVPVSGAPGQSIVLGRRTARLTEVSGGLSGRTREEGRHVV